MTCCVCTSKRRGVAMGRGAWRRGREAAQRRGSWGRQRRGVRPRFSDLGAGSPAGSPNLGRPVVPSCLFPLLLPALGQRQPLAIAVPAAHRHSDCPAASVCPLCPSLLCPRQGSFSSSLPTSGPHHLSGSSPADRGLTPSPFFPGLPGPSLTRAPCPGGDTSS